MTRTFTQLLESGRKPLAGWKVKADDRCGHCSDTGEEDQSTYLKDNCPYCLGTGIAHWLPKFQGNLEEIDAACLSPIMDREDLKRKAEAATEGPWMHLAGDRFVYDRMEDGCRGNSVVGVDFAPTFYDQDAKNLDYIAAANPAAILSLIAEVKSLRKQLEQERSHLQACQKALSFWMPMVPSTGPEEVIQRTANDAYLLYGYEGEDEPSAEDIGWIVFSSVREETEEAIAIAHDAIDLMTRFHSHSEPDDTPDQNAIFPALAFREFVDEHARLMNRMAQFRKHPTEPAYLRLREAANEVCAVLGAHGTISARDVRVQALMDRLYETDNRNPETAKPAYLKSQPAAQEPSC